MEQQNSSIFNFKKFLKSLLLPVILLWLSLGIAFTYYFEKKILLGAQINGAYKTNRIINEYHPDEIPILGSSRAEGCYVPDILGSNYFNYGLAGTGGNVMLFFLEQELKKKKSTPVIINFDPIGLNYSIGDINYYLYNSNLKSIQKLLGKDYRPMLGLPFLKYYGYYEVNFKDYLNNKLSYTKAINNGGSFELNCLSKERFQDLVRKRASTCTYFKNDPVLYNLMENLITNTKRNIIIVVAPCHPSFFSSFKNEKEFEKFKSQMANHKNVYFLDYSKSVKEDTLFFDTMHLNYSGAKVFSTMLSKELKSLFSKKKELMQAQL